jgi:hypothetical protein
VGRIICGALEKDAELGTLAARSEALCRRRPLYPGFAGYATYVGDSE